MQGQMGEAGSRGSPGKMVNILKVSGMARQKVRGVIGRQQIL